MDLGLKGRTALVCASSRGLGRACAQALAREGVRVVINGQNRETLTHTAEQLKQETGAEIVPVVADITTPEGRRLLFAAAPDPDILVNNAGGPPSGDFRDWSVKDWHKALDANMLSAIELIKTTIDGMIERRFGRIISITSVAVKAPVSYLGLSNGARTGLTGFLAGLAREVSKHNVTINNLLPGSFATDRLQELAESAAKKAGISVEDQRRRWEKAEVSGRFGRPEELGAACAFLCSVQAGYITGQNLLIDGGAFPGAM
jgi:3-oxoacyl-[acyl-carrier protein] reductase